MDKQAVFKQSAPNFKFGQIAFHFNCYRPGEAFTYFGVDNYLSKKLLVDLVQQLTSCNPYDRPTASNALQHAYLNQKNEFYLKSVY